MKNRITRIISCFIFVALLPGNFAHAGSDALNKIFDVIQKIDSISKEKKKQEKKNRKGSQNQQGSGNQNGNSQQVGGGQNSGNRGISAFREQISCDKDYSGRLVGQATFNSITPHDVKKQIACGASLHDGKDSALNANFAHAPAKYKTRIAKILLDADADINRVGGSNSRGGGNFYPIILAVKLTYQEDSIYLLLNAGVDVNVVDRHNDTALLWAVFNVRRKHGETWATGVRIIQMLLDAESDVDAVNNKGKSAVNLADEGGDFRISDMLVADRNTPEYRFHLAVRQGDAGTVQTLGAKSVIKTEEGGVRYAYNTTKPIYEGMRSPLMEAIYRRHLDVIRALYNTVGVSEEEWKIALVRAAHGSLSDRAQQIDLPHAPVKVPAKDVMEVLLQLGADVNSADDGGNTALMIASHYGMLDGMEFLLQKGADIKAQNSGGYMPIFHAVRANNSDAVAFLINAQANINAQDNGGVTPLMHAAHQGNTEIVGILLDAKADFTLKDKDGKTALRYAGTQKKHKVTNILRKAGARR